MASSTQNITDYAAAQQAAANVRVQQVQQQIDNAGEGAEIEVFLVAVRYEVNYRQPTGATYTEAQFEDKLKELRLLI